MKNKKLKYPECSDCILDGYSTIACCVNRLELDFYYFCKEIPIINRMKKEPKCTWFMDKET